MHRAERQEYSGAGGPVPVGRAIDPPWDGWRWGTSESSPSGTEWTSRSRREGDCGRCGLLYPGGLNQSIGMRRAAEVSWRCYQRKETKEIRKLSNTFLVFTCFGCEFCRSIKFPQGSVTFQIVASVIFPPPPEFASDLRWPVNNTWIHCPHSSSLVYLDCPHQAPLEICWCKIAAK